MKNLLSNYGMVLVLIALCILFSLLTLKQESATGSAAAARLAKKVVSETETSEKAVLWVTWRTPRAPPRKTSSR